MDPKKSNKISDIVRLQQILKKWKKAANNGSSSSSNISNSSRSGGGSKSIKFLKRTLSFTDVAGVPKGYLAVCVGKELKRYVIPMEYLSHPAFGILLREAEEEFGFQQEGVLKIPCHVSVFDKILKVVQNNNNNRSLHDEGLGFDVDKEMLLIGCYSPDSDQLTPSHHPQMCR
ncbi:hypothetical protein Tsubulata_023785 [Turnera subulata]|uniref:Uncharacterized protein n=1 Tax=Turnera subulata TaxID=218843 RepID=A0A9Q0F7E4_9ROSI|nr:hypothetical protein Tsubulata_023785 [Turnera subulata]